MRTHFGTNSHSRIVEHVDGLAGAGVERDVDGAGTELIDERPDPEGRRKTRR